MLAQMSSMVLFLVVSTISVNFVKREKFDMKKISRISIFAALTMVLYFIKLVPFPQGGGCSLLSVLPIMILAVVGGTGEGVICAIIVASLKLVLAPPYYPLQIPLDYYGAMLVIAFTPLFGVDDKFKLFLGGISAGFVSMIFSVLSGVLFFSQFAPEGMNPWLYSFIYNVSGYGVEVIASVIVLVFMPLNSIRKQFKYA
ncbi:MAG: energy-coupled thiamine transporter ThiT [Tissierellales bacterium]|jgi:thiamine transporter|nr:energy-coupled thiamine transporter ThiT [Tissierellales bacterium]